MTRHQFADYRGVLKDAPKDRPVSVVSLSNGLIVWSKAKKTNRHRVRYGLQSKDFGSADAASEEFRQCVVHHATCEGLLDN